MTGNGAWAQTPYGANVLPPTPVGQLPPPIPGDPATFTYASQLGAYPWAYATWGGGYPLTAYPGGGVLAHPDAANGVMRVRAWWPNATALQLVRITSDGSRTGVRGGYPIVVTAKTRRNCVTNPSIEVGVNGFVPDAGSPTLAQLADAAAPTGSYVLRSTNASAGSNGVTVPTTAPASPSGVSVTVGFAIRVSALPSSVTVTIGWTDALGGALTANSGTLTGDQRAAAVSQFTRASLTFTAPMGAVTPTLKIVAAGMPSGGTMDLDALVFELGATDGSAFDGGTLGAGWVGTPGLSASVLAPVMTILDGECPLDELVSYQVTYPGITGGRVTSTPALLPSNRTAWLTHPGDPDAPIKVDLRRKPVLTKPILQGTFSAINRTRKVVVSAAARQGYEGTIEFNALSADQRTRLLAMTKDGSPLLLRSPAEYNFPDQWLSLATTTEDPEGRLAHQDAWLISAPYIEVEAPSVLA